MKVTVWSYTWDTDHSTGTRLFTAEIDAYRAKLAALFVEDDVQQKRATELLDAGDFAGFSDWYQGYRDEISGIDTHIIDSHELELDDLLPTGWQCIKTYVIST